MRFHRATAALGSKTSLMLTAAPAGAQGATGTSGTRVHLARRARPAIPVGSASGTGHRIRRPNDQIHRIEEEP
jgi:hypothetical protein